MKTAISATKTLTHHTREGLATQMTLYGADRFGFQPCVVYLHGFKGFKDWGFVPYTGQYFAERGICFLAVNFSHNGISPTDPMELSDMAKFRKNTLMREVDEALEFVQFAGKGSGSMPGNNQPVGILGHSRGGGIALIAGAKTDQARAVVTWAAISNVDRFDKKTRSLWRKQGFIEVQNSRTGQMMPIDSVFLEEIDKFGRTRLNILESVKALKKPVLFIHGRKDPTVPFYEAETLHIYGDPDLTRLRLIPGADHTFGVKHPFEESTPAFDGVLKETFEFFLEHLKKE